ncbi:major capsid protein [Caudoviricetes sp.]|nr:major capsid protein [Caudoviricetes sp.]
MGTNVVSLTSDLVRKRWMREGLIQAASKSFWSPMTGTTKDAVVFQANNENSGEGHTIVFDFDGNLSNRAIKGKNVAFGNGEQKKKFSDKLTVERYRLVADNGDSFDGKNVGSLDIAEHADSRAKLGDLFVRFKDQAMFDSAQGLLLQSDGTTQPTSHNIDLGTTFTFNQLTQIETVLRTGNGFFSGVVRRPPDPYMLANGEPVWLFVIDAAMAGLLRQDTNGFQTVISRADVRGADNRILRGVIGKIGSLMIVQADQFFGATDGTTMGWGMDKSDIEIAGLRQYDGANPTTSLWTGQTGFNYASTTLHSRGLILGAGALQFGMGKQPDYKWQPSEDFAIKSESALETWMEVRKTKLVTETENYKSAIVSGIDYGVVTVDVEVQ